jgi:hypothetical protein
MEGILTEMTGQLRETTSGLSAYTLNALRAALSKGLITVGHKYCCLIEQQIFPPAP